MLRIVPSGKGRCSKHLSNQSTGKAMLVQILRAGIQGQGLGQRKDMAVVGMEGTLNPWLG